MKSIIAIGLLLFCFAAKAASIPTVVNLFGPAQTPQSVLNGVTAAPQFVGMALTGSTHWFKFSQNMRPVVDARLLVVWASRNVSNYIRIIHFDNGPANIVEIGRIYGNGSMNPSGQALDFTQNFNNLVTQGIDKHIGFQIGGDGVNQWTLYEVQLELNFDIP